MDIESIQPYITREVPTHFSCITCRLRFHSSDTQREHYKTNFHLFNSKRKIAGLNPVSQETFEKKLRGM